MSGLDRDQGLAADPLAHAMVSASAGTGKTHLLTNRVFRLLLGGVAPETILCLTFTRAGAANMAERIGERLASWVRMEKYELARELQALGEPGDPNQQEVARKLFAKVLDAPGGIRIQTIHAFAQSLLAAFPAEAGIAANFKPLEGRAAKELQYNTLAEMVSAAEESGNRLLIEDIERLSERLSEKGAVKYLNICADRSTVMETLDLGAVEQRLRELTGVHACDVDQYLEEQCGDGAFDCALLRRIAEANRGWGTQTGDANVAAIENWLELDARGRREALPALANVFLTGGKLRARAPKSEDYGEWAQQMADKIVALIDFERSCKSIEEMVSGLRAGKAFASAYARAKAAAGVADFNDLIAWTRRLLETEEMADWVRYKLDRQIDHVLVDEAQDTNADQWAIVDAIVSEFFTGSSEAESRRRTLLAVGDFKQAIFSFQGADPSQFERMRTHYKGRVDDLLSAETNAGEPMGVLPLHEVALTRSFRSAQGLLDLVDEVIAVVGAEEMGLPRLPPRHETAPSKRHLTGTVDLWDLFAMPSTEVDEVEAANDGEENWIDLAERRYATAIADEIRQLIDSKEVLGSTGQPVRPGDIMVLVRSRRALSPLIVARLFEAGVPVAGIDRLRLREPLAVQDLLAAMRFAAQPLDDLNLACVLVSPLIGWDQDQLRALAFGRKGSLWSALRSRAAQDESAAAVHETLVGLLNLADFTSPARFLETVLSGPMRGRSKLCGRLGMAARDSIEELLSTALAFEREEGGTIERFLAWFRRGELEVVRDPAHLADEVRVMTVHGAKGLEAPIVILADAQIDPDDLGAHDDPILLETDDGKVPLSRSGASSLPESLKALIAREKSTQRQEHMRLLYVALTRAVERLVVAGIKPARKGGIKPNAWYSKIEQAMINLGAKEAVGALSWGGLRRFHRAGEGTRPKRSPADACADIPVTVPGWAHSPAPVEERPPRPLAPSLIAIDDETSLPPSEAMRAAAQRGTLIHSLLERLPGVPPEDRRARAMEWLRRSGGVKNEKSKAEIVDQVCAIISDPHYADLFGPNSLGEAPLAATLPDLRVVAGTVDRLLIEPSRVAVIDFKTGRVPQSNETIPTSHRAQMNAYTEALKVIFPGRKVEASLLYIAGPVLFRLDA